MRIVIIGAMKAEIEFLVTKLENKIIKDINNFKFYCGKIYNNEIILVNSGIGKVMSGILIATLVNNFEFDKVINVGVAGGVSSLNIGDIVIAESCVYGDVDLSGIDNVPYGKMANFPLLFTADIKLLNDAKSFKSNLGVICTSDKFVTKKEDINLLKNKYFKNLNILCFDMETAAFAQSCYFYNIDFIAIRAISDIIGSSNEEDSYLHNLEKACAESNNFVLKLLKKI